VTSRRRDLGTARYFDELLIRISGLQHYPQSAMDRPKRLLPPTIASSACRIGCNPSQATSPRFLGSSRFVAGQPINRRKR
jgi:hypothetical protein